MIPAAQIKNCNLRYINVVDIVEASQNSLQISVNDADGDVTSAAYYNAPTA